jgi:predicted small lipoprotein YifL
VGHHEVNMTRVALVSFALVMLATTSGCGRKPTTPPEAPAAKTDFAPPEEYELAGPNGSGEEEDAPGLNGG